MVIVHVVEPFASGVAYFVKSLTEAMPDDTHIVVHGERQEEIAAKKVKQLFHHPRVRFIRWRSATRSISPVKDMIALFELHTILKRLKEKKMADAVHLHSSKSGFLGRVVCRWLGIKNVFYTPNGASFLSSKNKILASLYRFFEKIGNRLGGKVICSSHSELSEYRSIGIKAFFINNGINLKPYADDKKTGIKNKFIVVTAGRIEDQKNPALFNEIASYFTDMPEVEFIWIGEGSQKEVLQSSNIKVTGWLPSSSVHELLKTAHIYLSTSRYEGLSFAALEALSFQKPVLLSNCTGNSDLVKSGINGNLFSSAYDGIIKILQYLNNKEMLPLMGKYSKEICFAEFDGNKNFRGYRNFYAGDQRQLLPNAWSLS